MEEKDKVTENNSIDVQHKNIDTELKDISQKIIDSTSADELADLTNLFKLNMMKKNMARTLKYLKISDVLADEIYQRALYQTTTIEDKDLKGYFKVIMDAVNSFDNNKDSDSLNGPINLTQINNNNINVNPELNNIPKESAAKITKAFDKFMEAYMKEEEMQNNDEQ